MCGFIESQRILQRFLNFSPVTYSHTSLHTAIYSVIGLLTVSAYPSLILTSLFILQQTSATTTTNSYLYSNNRARAQVVALPNFDDLPNFNMWARVKDEVLLLVLSGMQRGQKDDRYCRNS